MKQRWVFATSNYTTSTPVVLNGSVYFADWGGNVYSLNIANGKPNWQVNLGGIPISSSMALANGMVYVGSGLGQTTVYALSQTDGHTVWSTALSTTMDSLYSSPIVYNGLVYIGVSMRAGCECETWRMGEVVALNAMTGTIAWKFSTMIGSPGGAAVWGSVVVDPTLNAVYFGTGNSYALGCCNTLYAYSIISLKATSGSLNWYYQTYNSVGIGGDLDFGSTPNLFSVQINGTTYNAIGLGSKDGKYYILDRTNGKLLESSQIGTGGDAGGIVGLAGFIYLSPNNPEMFIPSYYHPNDTTNGTLVAFTASSRTMQWRFDTAGTMLGSIALVPGAVFLGDGNGSLYAVSTTSGAQLFHAKLPAAIDSGITVAEGYVLVTTSFGRTNGIYAFSP